MIEMFCFMIAFELQNSINSYIFEYVKFCCDISNIDILHFALLSTLSFCWSRRIFRISGSNSNRILVKKSKRIHPKTLVDPFLCPANSSHVFFKGSKHNFVDKIAIWCSWGVFLPTNYGHTFTKSLILCGPNSNPNPKYLLGFRYKDLVFL